MPPELRGWCALPTDQKQSHEFEAADGTVISRSLTPDELMDLPLDAARKALYLTDGGKKYFRRKPTIGGSGVIAMPYDHNQYPKVSTTLPKWCEGAEHITAGRQRGKPIVESARHERELCKRYGYTRDYGD